MGRDGFTKPPHRQAATRLPRRSMHATLAGMEILLNGQPCRTREGTTLAELLGEQGLAGRRVAVELNGEIVPRGRHGTQVLQPGDRVEIVHALGGG
jgi:sulfur carrier protein